MALLALVQAWMGTLGRVAQVEWIDIVYQKPRSGPTPISNISFWGGRERNVGTPASRRLRSFWVPVPVRLSPSARDRLLDEPLNTEDPYVPSSAPLKTSLRLVPPAAQLAWQRAGLGQRVKGRGGR